MGTAGPLKEVQDQLIKELKETTVSSLRLAKKYGVSRQAIYQFIQRKGITRPKKPKIEHTEEECLICQGLLRIARQPHSEFICKQTLREQLGLQGRELSSHLSLLRSKKLVSEKFGRLYSKRVEQAYQIYFEKRLPVKVIGKLVGFESFGSIILNHKASGWDVPAPLFKYDGNERRIRFKRKRKQWRLGQRFLSALRAKVSCDQRAARTRGAFTNECFQEMVKAVDRERK